MVILDTNVVIDHLRQSPETPSLFKTTVEKMPDEEFGISVITIQELYVGQSTKKPEAEKYLLQTITDLNILPYTREVAILAGKITRDLERNMGFADAAIAATAILNNCQLLTLNKKDFVEIKSLNLLGEMFP